MYLGACDEPGEIGHDCWAFYFMGEVGVASGLLRQRRLQMKKELDGEWIPLRLGIRDHLRKMTSSEATLFIYYLVSVDHLSWRGYFSVDYLEKALGWGRHRVIDAKDGLVKKGYIKREGQTSIYIPRLKKFKKQAEAEISAPLLARIKTLERMVNSVKTAPNSVKTAPNSVKTAPNTRKREKKQQPEKQEDVDVVGLVLFLKEKGARQVSKAYCQKLISENGVKKVHRYALAIPDYVSNKIGWLTKALKGNWDLPPTPEEEREARKKKLAHETRRFEEEHKERLKGAVDFEAGRKRVKKIIEGLKKKMSSG